jgi:hypothetical protein
MRIVLILVSLVGTVFAKALPSLAPVTANWDKAFAWLTPAHQEILSRREYRLELAPGLDAVVYDIHNGADPKRRIAIWSADLAAVAGSFNKRFAGPFSKSLVIKETQNLGSFTTPSGRLYYNFKVTWTAEPDGKNALTATGFASSPGLSVWTASEAEREDARNTAYAKAVLSMIVKFSNVQSSLLSPTYRR